MTFIYSPPYDSPIEDMFACHLSKFIAKNIVAKTQVPVDTICGCFILDFVFESPRIGKIAIECDGRDFHNESRDEWRDAMILGEKVVDKIYRIRGSDIIYHIYDVLYCISSLESDFMSESGVLNLHSLATSAAKSLNFSRKCDFYSIRYPKNEDDDVYSSLKLEKREVWIPKGERRFWQAAYNYAVSMGGGCLDDVIANYRRR